MGFYTARPEKVHHGVALGFPSLPLPFVTDVQILSVGMGVLVRKDSTMGTTSRTPHFPQPKQGRGSLVCQVHPFALCLWRAQASRCKLGPCC